MKWYRNKRPQWVYIVQLSTKIFYIASVLSTNYKLVEHLRSKNTISVEVIEYFLLVRFSEILCSGCREVENVFVNQIHLPPYCLMDLAKKKLWYRP